jgi:hypothetical protein
MDKVDFKQLPLLDLMGNPAELTVGLQPYLLLIFLRHLA